MTLQSLYNGNIAGWMWNSRDNTGAMQTRLGSVYRYDQLNRLRVDSVHTWNGTNAWVPGSKWLNYYSYDADGNIKTLYRNDDGGNGLDNLQYHYITGKPNQLRRVQEHMAATAYTGDLENQAETDNYAYDATGNLTQDVSENIRTGGISWTPYNKIDRIVKVTGGTPTMKLAYLYDASGNRVIKDYYATDTSSSPTRTYYVRDAQGNVMGIFKRASGETYAERQETPIYGSSRLGVSYKGALHKTGVDDTLAHYNTLYTRELRLRGYELTDHLGNVRATVSDMLVPRGSGVFDADLRTLTDYYPFGMTMPGRSYEAAGINSHRYGYNGKENDNEVKGEGNQQDYGFRIYDPRVGRWLSVDPLQRKFPSLSSFLFCYNSPISVVDPDGREGVVVSGQPGDHKNREHFLTNGLNRAKAMAAEFKQAGKGETATWIIYNGSGPGGYDAGTIEKYQKLAGKAGVAVIVVDKASVIVDYVNNKNGTDSRAKDQISKFSYFGHATPGDLDVGFVDHDWWNMLTNDKVEPSNFSSRAFRSGCMVNVVGGCRTAVDGNLWGEQSVIEQFSDKVDNRSTVKGSSTTVFYPGGVVSDEKLVEPSGGRVVEIKGKKKD